MVTGVVTTGGTSTPIWVTLIQFAQLILLIAFTILAVYAGWKAFLWLRGWHPHQPKRNGS